MTNTDWSDAFNLMSEELQSFTDITPKLDQAYVASQRESYNEAIEQLDGIATQLSANCFQYLRALVLAARAMLERRLNIMTESHQSTDECFDLCVRRSRLGFDSPLEKARLAVSILTYLEELNQLEDGNQLRQQMIIELEKCMGACSESIDVLKTFGQ